MKEDIQKLYEKDYLTQKDIIQLLLHNSQHMVTREEVKQEILATEARLNDKIEDVEDNAKRLLGIKYVWGATGPYTYDCSMKK